MVTNSLLIPSAGQSYQLNLSYAGPLRVGIVSDFLEENWPSMKMISDMLTEKFQELDATSITAAQLRPAMRWRCARIPGIGSKNSMRNADRFINRFFDYPRWLRRRAKEFDLFHIVDHSYSQLVHELPSGRSVVTCHDLDTFRCLLEPAQEQRPRWFRAMAQRVLDGFLKAAHVICNSGATRDQLLRYQLFPPERMTVIHIGVHAAFTPLPNPAADAEAARLLRSLPENEVRLLSVGSTIPRKRMDLLLRILAAVKQDFPGVRLLRVGGAFTAAQLQLARELGVEQSVLVLPFVSSAVLAAIYRRATLLLQPSDAEGFGMPITEAMACGCPVLASDLAVLREVGGAACTYCAVGDVEGWKQAVITLLREGAESQAVSLARRQQAQSQAARYSWAEHARQTAQVYAKLLSSACQPV